MHEAAKLVKATPENLGEKIGHLLSENKALHAEVDSLKSKLAQEAAGDILDQVQEIGESETFSSRTPGS